MEYRTRGICAQKISFDVVDNKVGDVTFFGGCPGNHLGLAALVKGMDIDEAISRLSGIDCGGRGTSCPDQLACALRAYKGE